MLQWLRREPLLAGATLALPILFALDFLSDVVFVPSFFVIPVVLTAPLGRPRATVGVGAAAWALSAAALSRGDFPTEAVVSRLILLAAVIVATTWVAEVIRRGRRRLREQEAQMRILAENASDIVFRTSADGVIEWISPSVQRELGHRPESMVGQGIGTFLHPDDVPVWLDAGRRLTAANHTTYRARFQTRSGGTVWMEVRAQVVLDRDALVGCVASARNIDRQVKLEGELRRRATTDELTGATRREEAIEHLQRLQHVRERTGHGSAVIFCDIDLFKEVNDTYGHAGGDEVLREVAERFRRSLREEDSVARFGGDEFVVILHSIHSIDDAQRIAEKLHSTTLRGIPMPDGRSAHVTLSMGLAEVRPGESITDVLGRADAALYSAKHAGRDRVVRAS